MHYEVRDKPVGKNMSLSKNGGKARIGGSKQARVSAVILCDARRLFSREDMLWEFFLCLPT